jgi:hypothetical protein
MTTTLGAALVVQALVIGALLTLSLDVYAHKRVEQLGGVNIWGYRGATARVKQPNEMRLGIIGGTLAFSWGVAASETAIAGVRQLVALAVDRPGRTAGPVTAINLGALGWPPSSYGARFERFSDLSVDVLCVYPDPHGTTPRTRLPAAAIAAGYTPILPLVLREKAGWRARPAEGAPLSIGEDDRAAVEDLVRRALARTRGVVLVLPPPASSHLTTGWEPLSDRFRADARVRVVDLALDPRLQDAFVRLDDLSYGAGGNAAAAEQIAPAVIELVQQSVR